MQDIQGLFRLFGRFPLIGELIENHADVGTEAHIIGLIEVGQRNADAPTGSGEAVTVQNHTAGFRCKAEHHSQRAIGLVDIVG